MSNNDNKSCSNNILTVNQSIRNDETVDSHMLDQYECREDIEIK